jgi:hypothetical protein
MNWCVVVHKLGKVEKVHAGFPTQKAAQLWADEHVVIGNKWVTCEFEFAVPVATPMNTPPPPSHVAG